MKHFTKNTGFNNYNEVDLTESPTPISVKSSLSLVRETFSNEKLDHKIAKLIKKAPIAYVGDALIRQAVDRYSELFKDFELSGGTNQVKYLTNRLTNMSLISGETWRSLFSRAILEYFKSGNAFFLKMRGGPADPNLAITKRAFYDQKPHKILRLMLLSPDRMEPFMDQESGSMGWELKDVKSQENFSTVAPGSLNYGTDGCRVKNPYRPPKNNILLPGLDVVHLAYKRGAESRWGFGMTLGAMEDVNLLRTLEETTAVMTKKYASPLLWHRILRTTSTMGSIQQDINLAAAMHRQGPPDGVLVTGGNVELKVLGSESQAIRTGEYLHFFLNRSLAGLGVSPFLLGIEAGTVGSVEAAIELMLMRVRFCQEEISREIEEWILNELLWEGGFDPISKESDKVKLVFKDIDESRMIKLQNHYADLHTKNFASLEESRSAVGMPSKSTGKMFVDRVDIPRIKAKPVPKPSTNNSIAQALKSELPAILPNGPEGLQEFLETLVFEYGQDRQKIMSMLPNLARFIDDKEAFLEYLVQELENE